MPTCAIASLVFLIGRPPVPQAVGPLVIPVDVKVNQVTVTRQNHRREPGARRYTVRVGDVVRVGAAGRASLRFVSIGRLYTLPPGSSLKIGRAGANRLSGPEPRVDKFVVAPHDPTRDKRLIMATEVRGGGRGINEFGAFRHGPIRLTWDDDLGAEKIVVELQPFSGSGSKLFGLSGRATAFEVPAGELRSGLWLRVHLSLRHANSSSGSGDTLVRTLTEADRKRLALGEGQLMALRAKLGEEYDWAHAELLASYGLVTEMLEVWRAGLTPLKLAEDSAGAQQKLGELYEQAGFPAEAHRAYERAREGSS